MNFFNTNYLSKENFAKLGKTIIIVAVLELIAALILLFQPLFGTEVLIYFLGFSAIFGGISKIILVAKNDASQAAHKGFNIFLGILYILAGIIIFFEPVATLVYLTFVFGFLLIFEGFGLLFSSNDAPSKGLAIANGIITLILGFLVVFGFPESLVVIPIYIGLSFLINGIVLLTAYFGIKSSLKDEN